jgi:hypothetical protein
MAFKIGNLFPLRLKKGYEVRKKAIYCHQPSPLHRVSSWFSVDSSKRLVKAIIDGFAKKSNSYLDKELVRHSERGQNQFACELSAQSFTPEKLKPRKKRIVLRQSIFLLVVQQFQCLRGALAFLLGFGGVKERGQKSSFSLDSCMEKQALKTLTFLFSFTFKFSRGNLNNLRRKP